MTTSSKHRAFLKWAGGKYALVEQINRKLPKANSLVEPFVGAGSVFLNTNFERYYLNDVNKDLINLYQILQKEHLPYINEAKKLFTEEANQAEFYYQKRVEFNDSTDALERAVLFLYLNRFGYNGLCRYNLSGKFNVPFGRYKAPYFPEKELHHFAAKAKSAVFTCLSYNEVMSNPIAGAVYYCDPPYAPISPTANFTAYAKGGFSMEDQQQLAQISAQMAKESGIPVLISNHDTKFTRDIYKGAKITKLKVARYISQKGHKRTKVKELMALYK